MNVWNFKIKKMFFAQKLNLQQIINQKIDFIKLKINSMIGCDKNDNFAYF